jgi:hypothetical protein
MHQPPLLLNHHQATDLAPPLVLLFRSRTISQLILICKPFHFLPRSIFSFAFSPPYFPSLPPITIIAVSTWSDRFCFQNSLFFIENRPILIIDNTYRRLLYHYFWLLTIKTVNLWSWNEEMDYWQSGHLMDSWGKDKEIMIT